MHKSGHILDLINTNISYKFNIRPIFIDTYISDHKTVCVAEAVLDFKNWEGEGGLVWAN